MNLFASMLKSERFVKQPWGHPVPGPSTHLSRQASAIATLSPWHWWRQSWIPNPVDVQFQMPRVPPTCKSAKTIGLKLKQNCTTWFHLISIEHIGCQGHATCKKKVWLWKEQCVHTALWCQDGQDALNKFWYHNTTHRTCHKYCRTKTITPKTYTTRSKTN